jgi:hypothetical protein
MLGLILSYVVYDIVLAGLAYPFYLAYSFCRWIIGGGGNLADRFTPGPIEFDRPVAAMDDQWPGF